MTKTISENYAKQRELMQRAYAKQRQTVQASYDGGRPSEFRRERAGLGGSGDAHYSRGLDHWRMITQSRDMDRNDMVFGQMVDRAVNNVIKEGIRPDPNTGDAGLDAEIRDRWNEWASDSSQCDLTGKFNFYQMQQMALRACIVDGDIFALPLDIGKLQFKEAHEVAAPNQNQHDSNVLGVEIDINGKPINYWFQKPRPQDRKRFGYLFRRGSNDFNVEKAFHEDGTRRILHIFDPKRYSNSRGVPWAKSVFDIGSMIEDGAYAKLIQNQISSCIALFIKTTDPQFRVGAREERQGQDGLIEHVDTLEPGKIMKLRPNDEIQGFAPNIASAEWFDLMKFFLRVYGAQLGLPLSLVLMDTSDTVFHGYRAEMEQAKIGFRRIQSLLNDTFNAHVYRWKLWDWFPRQFANERTRRALTKHKWQSPGWPYVDPEKDVKADAAKLEHNLSSPRRVVANQGHDWEQIVDETVADRSYAIRKAIEETQAIEKEFGVKLHWRELLNLAAPSGVSVSIMNGEQTQSESQSNEDEATEDENENENGEDESGN